MFLGKQRRVKWTWLAVIAIAVLVSVSSTVPVAASQIHFDIDTLTPGQILWEGGNNPLVGINIEVDTVMGLETPSNKDVSYNLIGGSLNFTTGNLSTYTSIGGIHQWVFNGGGSLGLTGGVDLPDTPGDIANDTTLMSGTFSYTGATHLDFNPTNDKWFVTLAAFTDEKNDELLAFFGMPDVDYYGNFNISFEVAVASDFTGPFEDFVSSKVLSGDITNHPVPIPASALLLGSGMVGLIAFGQRMRKKVF